jgi:tetratricopeptide (TPR) repeat protein
MRNITVLLLFFITSAFGQPLSSWLKKEAEENPEAYIKKASSIKPVSAADVAGNLYVLGKCYDYLNKEDIALKYLILSKKEFEKIKFTEQSKDLALEIHKVISSQENYDKYGTTFFNEYYAFAKKTNSRERLANSWNEFGKMCFDEFDFETRKNIAVLDSAETYFKKGLYYANQIDNDLIKARLYTNLSTLENTRANFTAARDYLDSAQIYSIESGDRFVLFLNYYTYGNNYFLQGDYKKAIEWFKKAEQIKVPKYRLKSIRLLYKKLMEAYDLVNDQPNRRKYQSLYLELDNDIKDREQNIAIHDINVKYQVEQKDRQISSLEKFKDKFHKNRLVFSILLFLVFLLALYSFVRWKRLDSRKQTLEQEKEQMEQEKLQIEEKHSITVQELEKVKSIVTEGYIILKDKSKVYLNDLMYIKSEDHYLHTFSKDGKSQFVRGKLAQILTELPPNFVKCHRSYIVNTNYIHSIQKGFIILKNKTEIPVSRGFKL